MSIRIGDTTLRHGLILAPMAGAADASFRAVCRAMGAEYTVTEMISAKALCYEQKIKKAELSRTAPLADVYKNEEPMSVQILPPPLVRPTTLL